MLQIISTNASMEKLIDKVLVGDAYDLFQLRALEQHSQQRSARFFRQIAPAAQDAHGGDQRREAATVDSGAIRHLHAGAQMDCSERRHLAQTKCIAAPGKRSPESFS